MLEIFTIESGINLGINWIQYGEIVFKSNHKMKFNDNQI